MEPLIIIDGERARSLDVRDRGLAYGHGLFETMRLASGRLPLWSYHEARLVRGLAALGIPWQSEVVRASLDRLLALCKADGVVKLTVTAGVGGRGYAATEALNPSVIVQWLPVVVPQETIILQLSDYRLPVNPVLAGIKHLNRLDQVMAARTVPAGRVPLLLDARERLVEALSHNVFVYHGGRWLTPDLQDCGVDGVMRTLLLREILPALGLEVEVCSVDSAQLGEAEEIFVSNAVAGVQGVAELVGVRAFPHRPNTDVIRRELVRTYSCFTVC